MQNILRGKEYYPADKILDDLLDVASKIEDSQKPGTATNQVFHDVKAKIEKLKRTEKIMDNEPLVLMHKKIARLFLDYVRMPYIVAFDQTNDTRVEFLVRLFKESRDDATLTKRTIDYFQQEFLEPFIVKFLAYREEIMDDFVLTDEIGSQIYSLGRRNEVDVNYVETFFRGKFDKSNFLEFYKTYIFDTNDIKELSYMLKVILYVVCSINEINSVESEMEIHDRMNVSQTPFDVAIYESIVDKQKDTDPNLAIQEMVRELCVASTSEISEKDIITTPNVFEPVTHPKHDLNETITTVPYITKTTDKIHASVNLGLRIEDFKKTKMEYFHKRFLQLPSEFREESRSYFVGLISQIAIFELKWNELVASIDSSNDAFIQTSSFMYCLCFEKIVEKIQSELTSYEEAIKSDKANHSGSGRTTFGAYPFSDLGLVDEAHTLADEVKEIAKITPEGVVIAGDFGDITFTTPEEDRAMEEESKKNLEEIAPGMAFDTGNETSGEYQGDKPPKVVGDITGHESLGMFDGRDNRHWTIEPANSTRLKLPEGGWAVINGTLVMRPFNVK